MKLTYVITYEALAYGWKVPNNYRLAYDDKLYARFVYARPPIHVFLRLIHYFFPIRFNKDKNEIVEQLRKLLDDGVL